MTIRSQTDTGYYDPILRRCMIGFGTSVLLTVSSADADYDAIHKNAGLGVGAIVSYATFAPMDGGGSGTVTINADGSVGIASDGNGPMDFGTYDISFSFLGGNPQAKYIADGNYSDIEALFTVQTLDSNNRFTVYTPEVTSQIAYVDAVSGNDGTGTTYTPATLPNPNDWQDPGAVNAYKTAAAARAALSDNAPDWLLLKEDQDHDINGATLNTRYGSSNTARFHLGSYGPNGNRAVVYDSNPTFTGAIINVSANYNYVNIFNLYVHSKKRDPDEASFVGFGYTSRQRGIDIYGGSDSWPGYTTTGVQVENCRVSHCSAGIHCYDAGVMRDIVLRYNVLHHCYNEAPRPTKTSVGLAHGYWSARNQVLFEYNYMYHNGWLEKVDATKYAHAQSSGSHTGATSTTQLEDNTKNWSAATLDGGWIRNGTTGSTWIVNASGTGTTTLQLTLYESGSRDDWQAGDTWTSNFNKMRGQASLLEHNAYNSGNRRCIWRHNVTAAASSIGIKLTSNPTQDTGTHTTTENSADLIDNARNWPVNGLVGRTVENTTKGETATITANTATTITGTLSGGADWDIGDAYELDWSTDQYDETHIAQFGFEMIQHGNIVLENELSIGAGGNDTWQNGPRWSRFRVFDNWEEGTGNLEQTNRALGWCMSISDWKDGMMSKNIVNAVGKTGVNNVFGMGIGTGNTTVNNVVIARNFIGDIGLVSGSSNSQSGSMLFQGGVGKYTDLWVIGNYLQNENKDGKVIGDFITGAEAGVTFRDQKYYTLRTAGEAVDIDDAHDTIANFAALVGETGYSTDLKTMVGKPTIADYMISKGKTGTNQAFYDAILLQERSNWDEDLNPRQMIRYAQDRFFKEA